MRVRDAEATRRRLLDAALEEFAAHGIAGARVDRIAAAAKANKALIYSHFGSKDGLFEAVFAEQLDAITDAVPLDGSDLPGYAMALYDEYVARPQLIRLATWARLELRPSGDLFPDRGDHTEKKLGSIRAAQAAGTVDSSFDPAEVFALVTAVANTFSPASVLEAADRADPSAEHRRRRELLAEATRRMLLTGPSG